MVSIARWKIIAILLICLVGIICASPNLFSPQQLEKFPSWFPKQQVNLGLDLKGGSSILFEADVNDVIREHYTSLAGSLRQEFRKEKVRYTELKNTKANVVVSLKDPSDADMEKARKLIRSVDREAEIHVEKGKVTITLLPHAIAEKKRMALGQAIEVIRRRVDETGTLDPSITRQGENRILLQVPGLGDPKRIKELVGRTAKMSFHLGDESVDVSQGPKSPVAPGSQVLLRDDYRASVAGHELYYAIKKEALITGDMLTNAHPSTDQNGRPSVAFQLNTLGAKKFGQITAENVGRPFAIVLDDKIISVANIQEPIYGGNVQISGNFSLKEASDLALLLRAGSLPMKLTPMEERTVGPELGADSIHAGQLATVYAIILIAIFMIVAYSLFGGFANIALLMNLILLMGAISVMQATLTLPGIAGIALTLGMAVDANVLIYERIREEMKKGRSPLAAIDIGFTEAMRTIVDSNVTTLIGAALLFQFGTGAVRGFAVTLSLGIVISMFTAVTLTRLIVVGWYHWKRPRELPL